MKKDVCNLKKVKSVNSATILENAHCRNLALIWRYFFSNIGVQGVQTR